MKPHNMTRFFEGLRYRTEKAIVLGCRRMYDGHETRTDGLAPPPTYEWLLRTTNGAYFMQCQGPSIVDTMWPISLDEAMGKFMELNPDSFEKQWSEVFPKTPIRDA